MRSRFRQPSPVILLACFFASGFSALVYELLWVKKMSLTFGANLPAISVVTGTFMVGLALGSRWLGNRVDRVKSPVRLFALLELAIAGCAILFPLLLQVVTSSYILISQQFPGQEVVATLLRFVFSAVLLLPPTICMGGTFPVMCAIYGSDRPGQKIGILYAANTLGATFGVLACGFLLLPWLGVGNTLLVAVAINVLTAAVVFWLSRQVVAPGLPEGAATPEPGRADLGVLFLRPRLFSLAMVFGVGFVAMAYEILWTRLFTLYLGNTGFAFATILGCYLLGLSLGGGAGEFLLRWPRRMPQTLCCLIALMGIWVLLTMPLYDDLAFAFQAVHEIAAGAPWKLAGLSFLVTLVVVLPPALLSGAIIPLAAGLSVRSRTDIGRSVGFLLFSNTLGAVLGSLVAGFLLVPWVGLHGGFKGLVALNLLLAIACVLWARERRLLRSLVPALVLALGVLFIVPGGWNQLLINSGVYLYAKMIAKAGGLKEDPPRTKLIALFEDRDATVIIREDPRQNVRSLVINGKTDASDGRDMHTQVLLGQLPLLLHPAPRNVLNIGLGSGVTLAAVASHPVEHIDSVEISQGVIDAARYFEHVNGSVLSDQRVRNIRKDARNFLLVTPVTYDVIISEPSNPWQAGNANLFTREFYLLAASRLAEDGLFCQWIPLYDFEEDDLRSMTQTFLAIFPHVLVFEPAGGGDLVLVGSQSDLDIDYARLRARVATDTVQQNLSRIYINSATKLLGRSYLFSEVALRRFTAASPANTDDFSRLSSAYYRIFRVDVLRNEQVLYAVLGRDSFPFANLGATAKERAATLYEIAAEMQKAGKDKHAEYLAEAAEKLRMGH